jgi:hypothetical protein
MRAEEKQDASFTDQRTLYTAYFVFLFAGSVPNGLVQANPLSLAITYFRDDQAFL